MYAIDTDRTYDWATYCGIPGGIPERTTIYATFSGSATAAQINAAIAACPVGQVVYLSAGTYNISGISRKSGITVRGAGAGKTIISSGASTAFNYTGGSFNYDSGHQAIASGYTKGSTSITLSSSPGAQFQVGRLIMINQDDDHTLVFPRTGNWAGTRNLRHVSRITGITGSTITFSTPMPYTFVAAQNPGAQAIAASDSLFGVENMTIDAASCVRFLGSDRCWVKDCEIRGFDNEGIFVRDSHQIEIRRCYIHDCDGFPTQSDGYGLYAQYAVSNLLMEDCIGYHIAYGTVMNGNDSSAYLYNYMLHMGRDAATRFWQQPGFNCNHGPHSIMNLWEGNMAERWQNDAYHGSASHQTLFRNNIHGVNPAYTLDRRIMDFCRTSYYFNAVGNIIGDSSWNPNYYDYPATTYDRTHGTMYLLGWPNMGSGSLTAETTLTGFTPPGGSYPDTNVAATLIRHGNYDYYNDAVVNADGEDTELPDSLFYSEKPSFFGSLTWPPIDPSGPTVNDIPAKLRWDTYVVSEDIDDLFADAPSTTYWCSPTGTATWAAANSETALSGTACCSIATANANAAAGDTVYLREGTYTTYINPTNSGTADAKITFAAYTGETPTFTVGEAGGRWAIRLQGDSYIVIDGITSYNCGAFFRIGAGSCYNEIKNCTFSNDLKTEYSTALITWLTSAGAEGGESSHNWIHDNVFTQYGRVSDCGDTGTIRISANYDDPSSHNTFENNVFSYGGHDLMDVGGHYNVIRNNVFHNEEAFFEDTDGTCTNSPASGYFGNRCLLLSNSGEDLGTAVHTLVEGNRIGHAGTPPDDDGAFGIENAGAYSLIRYNDIYGTYGAGFYSKMQPAGAYPSAYDSGSYARVYNNNIYKCGGPSTGVKYEADLGYVNAITIWSYAQYDDWPRDIVIKNNIVYGGYGEFHTGTENILPQITYENNYNEDPSFSDPDLTDKTSLVLPDLTISSQSACIDAGTYLTQANGSGSSSFSLVVDDALYFQDGTWGSSLSDIQADWIAVGSVNNVVQISSIDYDTNTITLAGATSWADNAPVWLYKNSSGTIVLKGNAPDIGAHESDYTSVGGTQHGPLYLVVGEAEQAWLSVDYPKARVVAGTNATYLIRAHAYGDFTGDITLDATGLPTNATDAYATNPIAHNGSTTATITTESVSAGTYSIYFTGTSAGGDVASVRVVLEVVAEADADLKVDNRFVRAKQGSNAVFTIRADSLPGFTSDINLDTNLLPEGAVATFGDSTLAYNGTTTLTIDTTNIAPGTHEFYITG